MGINKNINNKDNKLINISTLFISTQFKFSSLFSPKGPKGGEREFYSKILDSKLREEKYKKEELRIHEYHLVENSPWPIYISISIISIIISIIIILAKINIFNKYILYLSILGFFICLFNWLKEIHIEGTLEGNHTDRVQKGLTTGFILFIISEICVFTTLFFAFFYNSLIPSIELSSIYPPMGIESINPKTLPLLNTIILFLSGITSTYSLNLLISKFYNPILPNSNIISTLFSQSNKFILPLSEKGGGVIEEKGIKIEKSIIYLSITIILGIIFSYLQYFEYCNASFTFTDSVFGSNFYALTGFHGIHGALFNF